MQLGQLFMTCGIAAAIEENPMFGIEVHTAFLRYLAHDWGDLCQEDKDLNKEALRVGERILASYTTSRGKVYIITEWDRSVTTILFADEY